MTNGPSTPYTTALQGVRSYAPAWVPEPERPRVLSYARYDDIYWSELQAFELNQPDLDTDPVYLPKARTVVDTTAHYLLKGLTIKSADATLQAALDTMMNREEFLTRFHVAKHSGVSRGDYILHITADPAKEPGARISITSVHPSSYYPVYDDWDPDKLIRVHLAEEYQRFEDGMMKTYLRKLTYEYLTIAGKTRVQSSEGFFETADWFDPKKAKLVKTLMVTTLLPPEITVIPVYHFMNGQWQGREYGTSDLAGFERLLAGINQTITDEELALALEGIGVFATDASGPVDPNTNLPVPWQISPGKVMEVPMGSYFARVKGVTSVTPMLDHVKFLQDSLYEASATTDVARGVVDVQVAASGIALAIRFSPMLAKIEERDRAGVSKLNQLWYDWKAWYYAFEEVDLRDKDIDVELGDKLPIDKTQALNELNNMLDRNVISAEFYRERMTTFGYKFPDNIAEQIQKEQMAKFEMAQKMALVNQPPGTDPNADPNADPGAGKSGVAGRPTTPATIAVGNKSNNAAKTNESNGQEAAKIK